MENLYLISGDDEYEKINYVEKIKEQFSDLKKGINFIQIDKDNMYTLEQELSTYSFFNEPKLIVVKLQKKSNEEDDTKSKKEWLTEDLEEKILNKIETITLVLIEEGTSKGKLNKLISKNGKVIVWIKRSQVNLLLGFKIMQKKIMRF